ncbi:MAG TPA: Spx/MgsR family RNA polymerase-binding regulatory protein [Kofleriaceae bacterium]|nr:Spx/MgsR family RNA polymerase-binding regulatory protein [Kofleriaceae bacterium]
MTLKVFQYPKCSTCRNAMKWLDAHGVAYEKVDIVEQPPSRALLAKAAKAAGLSPKKMFNTSGESYRSGGFKAKLDTMSDAAALAALAADGKLIRRPLVVGDDLALVGFKPDDWQAKLR